jgi:hypothetical protein
VEDVDFSDEFCRFVQALNRLLAHALTVVIEPASLVYVLRILGFGLIIGAIVDKNVQKPLARTQRRAR